MSCLMMRIIISESEIPVKGEMCGFRFIPVRYFHNTTSTMKASLDKRFTLYDAERRLRRACDQIVLFNQKLGEVQKCYKKARSTNNRSFRYNLRLKLAVIEGARNMFYDCANAKADQVADLRRELFNESVEIVSTDYMSESDKRE